MSFTLLSARLLPNLSPPRLGVSSLSVVVTGDSLGAARLFSFGLSRLHLPRCPSYACKDAEVEARCCAVLERLPESVFGARPLTPPGILGSPWGSLWVLPPPSKVTPFATQGQLPWPTPGTRGGVPGSPGGRRLEGRPSSRAATPRAGFAAFGCCSCIGGGGKRGGGR